MTKISLYFLLFCFCLPTTAFNSPSPIDSLLAILPTLKKEASVDHLLLIAKEHLTIDSSIFYAEKAIEEAKKLSYRRGLLNGYYFLGDRYNDSSFRTKAIEAFDKAKHLAIPLQDTLMMIKIACSKGYALHQSGKLMEAQQTFLRALDIADLVSDQSYKTDIYFGLGELYRIQHDVPKAIEYFDLSAKVNRNNEDQMQFFRIQYSKANTYKISKDEALVSKGISLLDSLLKSDSLSKKIPLRLLSLIHTTKGGMHTYIDEYDLALHHLEISIEYKKMLNNPNSLAYSYTELATLYSHLKNFKKAAYYAELAYKNHGKQDISLRYDILKNLSFTFSDAKDHQKAFRYLKKAFDLKDSLINQQKTEVFMEMEAKYKASKQEKKLTQQELKLMTQKNQINKILLFGLLFLSIIGSLSIRYYYRLRNKAIEASKSRELEALKGRFLANISHELRTPLSLIIGPLKQWKESAEAGNFGTNRLADIQLMTRNADRLQQLISQLLNLSKLNVNQVQLQTRKTNLTDFVKNMVNNFSSLSQQQEISLTFEAPEDNIFGLFDREKMAIILNNLLSNAFKFTPDKGRIKVALQTTEKEIVITVADNGEGISPQHLPYIFNRFYQADDSITKMHEGSGIGLALTKELVDIHKGRIEVKSKPGQGTQFTITLPLGNPVKNKDRRKVEMLNFKQTISFDEANTNTTNPIPDLHADCILIVEDNRDMRQFIRQCLEKKYQILEAEDGKSGFQIAKTHLPDLIISDVMMPGSDKDGFTFCKVLKETTLTSHIPVILLTAKANQEDIIQGFAIQADDYISKPFDPYILVARVQNLIQQRKYLKVRFAESIKISAEEITVASSDQLFLQQVVQEIEKQLDNENFGVKELGMAVNMDRTQLFRKLKALLGLSPSQMIKDIRMQRAKYLLENNVANVSQVSQMVGYRNPEYFSRSFKKEFNINPSEVLKKEINDI